MGMGSTETIACAHHPRAIRHVLPCRYRDTPVCSDCREIRTLPGTSVNIVVCTKCVRGEARARRLRVAVLVALVALVIAVVAASSVGPMYAIIPLAISAGFLYLSWLRLRTGTANWWDVLRVGSVMSRFLR
jgi:hypothetical protein